MLAWRFLRLKTGPKLLGGQDLGKNPVEVFV
jgi:hypothetical protein